MLIAVVKAAQDRNGDNSAHRLPRARLHVPGYGPGIAGQVTRAPLTPVCRPEIPCSGPYAKAQVQVLDAPDATNVLASAVTNDEGNFVLSVPPGDYIVRVQVTDFPICPDAGAHVGKRGFDLVTIDCDTGIR